MSFCLHRAQARVSRYRGEESLPQRARLFTRNVRSPRVTLLLYRKELNDVTS